MKLIGTSLAMLILAAGVQAAPGKLEYNRDIRPILAENCFACHGPDSAARKADLRLDRREEADQGGGHRARQAGEERAGRAHLRRRQDGG